MLDGSVRKVSCAAMALVLSAGCQIGCQTTSRNEGPDTGLTSLSSASGSGGGSAAESTETNDQRIARMAAEAAKDIEALRNPAAVKQNGTQPQAPNQVSNQASKQAPSPRATRLDAALAPLDISSSDSTSPVAPSTRANASPGAAKEPPQNSTAKPVPAVNEALAALPPRDAMAAEMGMFVARALRTLKAEPGNEGTMGQLVGILEAIQPGFLVGIEDLQSPTRLALGESDAVELLAHRHLVPATDVGATPSTSPAPEADEAPVAEPSKPVFAVANAHLCSRVTSFGQYEPLDSTTFAADRPIRALVYVEIENFENRETTKGRRLVEVSQTLALFSSGGSDEVWSTPEQSVREEGFRARRDFYLVQQVDLPRNLKLGSHTLKVTVTDKVSGAQAEATLPIRIVSDDRAAAGE